MKKFVLLILFSLFFISYADNFISIGGKDYRYVKINNVFTIFAQNSTERKDLDIISRTFEFCGKCIFCGHREVQKKYFEEYDRNDAAYANNPYVSSPKEPRWYIQCSACEVKYRYGQELM